MTNETQILAAFEAAGHEYLDMDDLTKTAETLDDFRAASAEWAECGEVFGEEYEGFAALEFDGVQVSKGTKRTALTVIDFGDTRYAYKA